MKIDPFAFARLAESASGTIALRDLPRVDAVDREATLAWTATGSMNGRHGAPRLDLSVDGEVALICQRCLQPMQVMLAIRSRFIVAADEATAEALDQDDAFDVVVGDGAFDLEALIEDEVILALPSAPRHAACPTAALGEPSASGRPSPFASLAALRRAPNVGDDD